MHNRNIGKMLIYLTRFVQIFKYRVNFTSLGYRSDHAALPCLQRPTYISRLCLEASQRRAYYRAFVSTVCDSSLSTYTGGLPCALFLTLSFSERRARRE